ncbi:ABC transporter ATP-binding protein/permease [Glycomyces sp. A-F 0318]|uniref:ATP-binding cassette domain-containing protein n=1 Tax=Glycomyces amatae TaxID=2881355 RepID=UPI001E60FF6E|nr:ABC transporter ATP-binding protein [Glycomyces amatae]MCD0442844.1 ABC transporter ATP-binding protein/permease [Glycomyces amatae]
MATTETAPVEAGLTFGAVVRRSRGRLPLIGASALLGSASMLALPLAMAGAVDAIVAGRGAALPVAVAAGLILLGVACDLVDAFAGAACAADAAAWLRTGLVRRVLGAPHRAGRFDAGDLVARLSAGAADAAHAGPAAVALVAAALPPLGSLALLAWLDWPLALAFLAGLALVGAVLRLFAKETAAAALDYQAAQGRMAARLSEALAGGRTIAAAGTKGAEARRILRELPVLAEHGRAAWRALSAAGARAAVAGPLATIGVLAAAGFALSLGRISTGELLAAGQYAMMGAGLGSLTGVVAGAARARAAVARLAEVHAMAPVAFGERRLPEGGGRLELRSVTVEGDAGPLLEEVSFAVPGGALAAVVGASGSGKSVLAQVAARLRDPDEGAVLLDGVPLPELSRGALRRAVGHASGRPALAGATLTEAMGPGRSRAEVAAAAEAVGAHAFAVRLPEGYDTPLGAVPMSGGEAQRIGLARAWPAERLLVLDDATGSLDAVSEQLIEEALAARGRTRLVVTHQVSAAGRADLVVWLDGGRVRSVGAHEVLWTDPDYRAVFAS